MGCEMNRNRSVTGWIVGAIVVVIVVAGIGIYWMQHTRPNASQTPVTAPAAPATSANAERYPINQVAAGPAAASTAPLPALGQSDASVMQALTLMMPDSQLGKLLVSKAIIPRAVATINALPNRQLTQNILPVHSPKGTFQVTQNADATTMDSRNAERYADYMQVVEHVDAHALVGWYKQHYPWFEQAYRNLGYAKGHFNDRLVFVIGQLLATPDVSAPVALKPYKSMYVFTDPAYESLTAGQKMLIRSGPANEARIKTKLHQIRQLLVGQEAPASATSAAQ